MLNCTSDALQAMQFSNLIILPSLYNADANKFLIYFFFVHSSTPSSSVHSSIYTSAPCFNHRLQGWRPRVCLQAQLCDGTAGWQNQRAIASLRQGRIGPQASNLFVWVSGESVHSLFLEFYDHRPRNSALYEPVFVFHLNTFSFWMGRMRMCCRSHHFATQSSHFVDGAGWQAKMASVEFWIPWRNAHGRHCVSNFNPLRANYCHTWHMENHPFLWRRIRRVRRIQVCMARKGLSSAKEGVFVRNSIS